jgi:hypothetical protein
VRFSVEPSPAGGFNVRRLVPDRERSMLHLFERLGRVDVRGIDDGVMQIDVGLPLDDMDTVLRSVATGHVGLGSRR